MAYVEEFTISGLAGHEKPVHRKLDRHINIFWGLNGTGKTSLLKILHGALRNEGNGTRAKSVLTENTGQVDIEVWIVRTRIVIARPAASST